MSMYNHPSLKNESKVGTLVPTDGIFVGGDTYVGQFEDKDWFMDTLRRLHAGDLSQRDIWLSKLKLSLLTGTNDELENVVGMFYD